MTKLRKHTTGRRFLDRSERRYFALASKARSQPSDKAAAQRA